MFTGKIIPRIPASQSRTDSGPYSFALPPLPPLPARFDVARRAAALAAALRAWNIRGLVLLAEAETDFLADLDPATLAATAANSADLAADISEDRTGIAVPLDIIRDVRAMLADRGAEIIAERERAEIDARMDGHDAGDLDADGVVIPYPTYRSV